MCLVLFFIPSYTFIPTYLFISLSLPFHVLFPFPFFYAALNPFPMHLITGTEGQNNYKQYGFNECAYLFERHIFLTDEFPCLCRVWYQACLPVTEARENGALCVHSTRIIIPMQLF